MQGGPSILFAGFGPRPTGYRAELPRHRTGCSKRRKDVRSVRTGLSALDETPVAPVGERVTRAVFRLRQDVCGRAKANGFHAARSGSTGQTCRLLGSVEEKRVVHALLLPGARCLRVLATVNTSVICSSGSGDGRLASTQATEMTMRCR